jgi:hypothetical protein
MMLVSLSWECLTVAVRVTIDELLVMMIDGIE